MLDSVVCMAIRFAGLGKAFSKSIAEQVSRLPTGLTRVSKRSQATHLSTVACHTFTVFERTDKSYAGGTADTHNELKVFISEKFATMEKRFAESEKRFSEVEQHMSTVQHQLWASRYVYGTFWSLGLFECVCWYVTQVYTLCW